MQKKKKRGSGGAALLAKYGPGYFSGLSKKSWPGKSKKASKKK